MDLEAASASIQVDTALSSDIAKSCNKLLETQNQITAVEEQLKKLQEAENLLSEQTIPNLMQQAGIAMLKLADGSSVEVKPFYAARIPSTKVQEAFDWLRVNGFGDLIKNNVTLTFGRAEDQEAKQLVDDLKKKGHNVNQTEKVEPMTLKAFVKEQIQMGRNVPADLFGVYVANKTKITTKE
jgi:polyhydroxyalkanoate synthesis regulator phasin